MEPTVADRKLDIAFWNVFVPGLLDT